MQTISVPYLVGEEDRSFLDDCRRFYSAAVRTAYANAVGTDEKPLKQKELRDLVKSRFAGGPVDAWTLHCATLEGMDLRRARPDGKMIFGTRRALERRRKGLIDRDEWRAKRLRPLASRGDKQLLGNRHFRLDLDGRACQFQMYGRKVMLNLAAISGNAGEVLRQAAGLAAAKAINVTFRLDDSKLHVTIDPQDLPRHPERRQHLRPVKGRYVGIDLNPNWIGIALIENRGDVKCLVETKLLDHALIKLDMPADASAETVRETLAAAAGRALAMARQWSCVGIALEKGLGNLRSSGRSRNNNRLLNYWARQVFGAMLARKAGLSGLKILKVWGGYSTTIGNLAYEAPDACASAAEIARRALARDSGEKDVLPTFTEGWFAGRWKDQQLPVEGAGWAGLHRGIKAAKLDVRRPHPGLHPAPDGYAVHRLGQRRRPGLIARAVFAGRALRDTPSSEVAQPMRVAASTSNAG